MGSLQLNANMVIGKSAVIDVDGKPQTKGSAKAIQRPGLPYPVIINDNKRCKGWQKDVGLIAKTKWPGKPTDNLVALVVTFYMARPKHHRRVNGELKPKAPRHHVVRPDSDKMLRAILDSLTGIVYYDDSQVNAYGSKVYADEWGVRIFAAEVIGDAPCLLEFEGTP